MLTHERAGPAGSTPVVLVHAGVADRRMWDGVWPGLTRERDAIRVDLPGFGESDRHPEDGLAPYDELASTLSALGVGRAHLVGASYGAGVVTETALVVPPLAASLLLAAPGGSLIPEATPDLRAFFDAEGAALEAGDLGTAVEANLTTWVDGPGQPSDRVTGGVRESVARMQRRAFEITADWGDVVEAELEPPALERLDEIGCPVLVLSGGLDVDAIGLAADRVLAGVRHARHETWPGVAHLPAVERPEDFVRLLLDWVAEVDSA